MKTRKLIIISPLGLLLLIAFIAAWWFLGDDAWIKGKLEDAVSEMTGRSLSIDGAFDLDWSSNPVLTAENIHFSNPSWAVNKDLAKLARLEVSIDLFSLFKDQIQVHYIDTDGLVIALEEHESGEKSWEILPGGEEPTPESDVPPAQLPVSIDRFTLADFSLLHETPDRTVPLDFHLGQLELIQRVDQHIQFTTDGQWGGKQIDLAGSLGPLSELVAGGKTSHDVRLKLGEIILQSQGSFEQSSTLSGANVKLAFSGPEVEWLLTQLALPHFSYGDFDFRLDLQTEGERTYLNIDGDLGSLHTRASGEFSDREVSDSAQLTADVSGEDLGGLLEVFGISGAQNNPFSLKVDVGHDSGLYKVQNLVLENTGNSITVSGQMGDWPDLADTNLDISVSGVDLQVWDALIPTENLPGGMLPQTEFDLSSRIIHTGSQPVSTDTLLRLGDSQIQLSGSLGKLPSMTGADLAVVVDGPVDGVLVQMLGITDIPGQNLNLKAEIKRDVSFIQLDQVSLELAGNEFDLSGKIGNWPELEGTDLTFSLNGPDLSIWSPLLGMDGLPASVFSLNGRISPATSGLALDAVRFELGGAQLLAKGVLGEPPGFIGSLLSIEATGPSLDEFRFLPGLMNAPALPFQVNGDIGLGENGLTFAGLDLELGDNSLHLSGQLGLSDNFAGSNLISSVVVPDLAGLGPLLGVEGLPAERLSVNGNFQRVPDGWAFQLSDGNFANASFHSDGKYIDSDDQQVFEATSQLATPDLARLARFAGVENLPPQPVEIKGFARYGAGQVVVRDIQGTVGDSRFSVSARVMNPPSWSGSEITLSASGRDIGQLLIDRGIEEALPFSVDGSLSRDDKSIRISQLKTRLGSLQANADGIIGNLDDLSGNDLELEIAAPSLKEIGELFGFVLPGDPFSLDARFQGSPSVFRLEGLNVTLGPSDLSGDMSFNLENKPRVEGILKSKHLDLAWIQDSDGEQTNEQEPGETGKKDYLIPDSPIALPRLDFADSDLEITIDEIKLPNQTLHDIYLHSRVTGGDLIVEPFRVRGEGDAFLSGNLAVDQDPVSDVTEVALSLEGKGVQLGFATEEGQDPDTIRKSDISAKLHGAGVTYRDLASSLNGHIEVIQGAGLTLDSGLGLIFGNFIGELLNSINPFTETEKFTVNECGYTYVNVESGVVTVDPVVLQTDKMTVVAKGEVDLHTEKILFTFNTKLRKGIGVSASMLVNPFVSVTGTLLSPTVGLDPAAVAVEGTVAVATVGISLLVKSLADRYLSSKDPCGDALKKTREQLESTGKKGKSD